MSPYNTFRRSKSYECRRKTRGTRCMLTRRCFWKCSEVSKQKKKRRLVQQIDLDGSTGEGGGQILRTGLALSMVTGRPLHITRIRAGRPKQGLMRQHLACVQAAMAVCGGQADGAELGSQTLLFTPSAVRAGDYRFQIATAG